MANLVGTSRQTRRAKSISLPCVRSGSGLPRTSIRRSRRHDTIPLDADCTGQTVATRSSVPDARERPLIDALTRGSTRSSHRRRRSGTHTEPARASRAVPTARKADARQPETAPRKASRLVFRPKRRRLRVQRIGLSDQRTALRFESSWHDSRSRYNGDQQPSVIAAFDHVACASGFGAAEQFAERNDSIRFALSKHASIPNRAG